MRGRLHFAILVRMRLLHVHYVLAVNACYRFIALDAVAQQVAHGLVVRVQPATHCRHLTVVDLEDCEDLGTCSS